MWLAKSLRAFAGDEDGATVIEYAIIAAVLSTAIIGSLSAIAPELVSAFQDVVEGFRRALA